ncbi:MAG: cysteine desulfurase [Bdellovibrionales bacterium]|nr:cysteine desulfurase [Bdellovibrionales bacterium]
MTTKYKLLYLDNHATTPIDPVVYESMVPYMKEYFGNPSSQSHAYGWRAELAVQTARAEVADLIGAKPEQIIFTSGATESNNLAILGSLNFKKSPAPHFITTNVEHKAILEVAAEASRQGALTTILSVDEFGQVPLNKILESINETTQLISVIYANNEIGTLNHINKIGRLAEQKNVLFHTDAAQAVGRVPIHVNEQKIDLLSLSGHKIYGPKGVGALFVRHEKIKLRPLMFGGSQELGIRPGTLNVPGIVGLGKACIQAKKLMEEESSRLTRWRDQIIRCILNEIPGSKLNGHPTERLCSNINISFTKLKGSLMGKGLFNLAFSSGSACSSAKSTPSHVLSAIGLSEHEAQATLRLGLGRFTTQEEVDLTLKKILVIKG